MDFNAFVTTVLFVGIITRAYNFCHPSGYVGKWAYTGGGPCIKGGAVLNLEVRLVMMGSIVSGLDVIWPEG